MDNMNIMDALKQVENTKDLVATIDKQLREMYAGKTVNKYKFLEAFAALDYRQMLLRIKLNRIVDEINAEESKCH